MRLLDYISSGGIPVEDNIFLINNHCFPGNIPHCIDWHATESKSLVEKIKRKIAVAPSRRGKHVFKLPLEEPIIFFGRVDRSMDDISSLDDLFKIISNEKDSQYTILFGKGDYCFDESFLRLIPPNVTRLFVNNLNIQDERLMYFPMGRDFRSRHLFKEFNPQCEKKHFVYCNFSVNTHPIRLEIYKAVKDNKCITFDHMGNFLEYSLSREEFYRKLSGSKFAICPRGNAIDTFRLWDCLYLGVIPIVLKEAIFHQELIDLPILFLDSIDDFQHLTADYLKEMYSEMLIKDWNYEKLKLSFWMSRVRAE